MEDETPAPAGPTDPRPPSGFSLSLTDLARHRAETEGVRALEDALPAALADPDPAAADVVLLGLLAAEQPGLMAAGVLIDRALGQIDRPHRFGVFADEGAVGIRVTAALPGRAEEITYWIREGDFGIELLADHVEATAPTDFALRTRRVFPGGDAAIGDIVRLVIEQIRT